MTDDELQNALNELPRERRPAPRLAMVLRTGPARRKVLSIAAAVLLVLAGAAIGRVWPRPQPTYLLLINDDAAPGDEASRAAEYGAWGRENRIRGNELTDVRDILKGTATSRRSAVRDHSLGGFFFLDATTERDALKIARRCPHLKYGGSVELRKIDR